MNARAVACLAVALIGCSRGEAPPASDSASTRATVDVRWSSDTAVHLPVSPDAADTFIARVFMEATGERPQIGWYLPAGDFPAIGQNPRITVFGPYALADSGTFVRTLAPDTILQLRRRHQVACDRQDDVALYRLGRSSGPVGDAALWSAGVLSGRHTDEGVVERGMRGAALILHDSTGAVRAWHGESRGFRM